jgi:hypothetical protein
MKSVVFFSIFFLVGLDVIAQQQLQTVYSTGGAISNSGDYQSITVIGEMAVSSFSSANFSGTVGYLTAIDQLITSNQYEISENIQFTVYPNPNEGIFNLELSGLKSESVSLSIINALGQHIYSTKLNSNKVVIDAGLISPGIYTIALQSITDTCFRRLVIQ